MTLGAAGLSADFMIAADGCAGTTLAAKGKCVVTLEFAPPSGSSGTLSGSLSYPFSYGANNGNVSIPLTGKVK